MFNHSANLYDLIYRSFKNYEAEADKVHELLSSIKPTPKTILDIACGTGEHAKFLISKYGYYIDGLDLDSNLLEIARSKNQSGEYFHGDMSSFDLNKKYDAVVCLFSSIGYLLTLDKVTEAISCFKKHTNPGGVIIIEPWFTPDKWRPGYTSMENVETKELKVSRLSYSEHVPLPLSRFRFEYLIGSKDGIIHEVEIHELGLFTVDEMKSCFTRNGLKAEYSENGLTGRGLYVAKVTL